MDCETVVKCVAVGDGFVGKTSLLMRLANKTYDAEYYTPTVFDNSSVEITYNGKKYDLHLMDTAGQEVYKYLRTQAYTNANVFLVCFSVTNMDSFSNVKEVWLPEIKKTVVNASLVLVGTKSDLRRDPETIDRMNISQEYFVGKQVAENFATSYNMKYVECSAWSNENVQDVINTTMQEYLSKVPIKMSDQCCINPTINLIKRILCCKHC